MIPVPNISGLPGVRRLEAVSFRSWPAATTYYDGTWAIRLTAGHPSKRLNSVNPLDRADHSDLERRIARAARRFHSFGRPLIFRQSPLAPPETTNAAITAICVRQILPMALLLIDRKVSFGIRSSVVMGAASLVRPARAK